MSFIAMSSVVSSLLCFLTRRIYEHTPRMNRWWISLIVAGIGALTTFIAGMVIYGALTALLITTSVVVGGVYLRELLNGLGRWLANPKHIILLVIVIFAGYLGLLAVVDMQFRTSLFSLALTIFIISFAFKGFKPIKSKK